MKVLHLVPAMEQGGVESVVCGLNRVAADAGLQSVVVSRGGRLAATIERDGGRHIALDLKSKNPLTYFGRAGKLRALLAAEKPDLVCAHSRVPAWLFVWANRALGLRWITYAHGANSVSRYSEVMTRGDITVAPSRFLADYLKAHYPIPEEKIRIVSNAVDSRRFDPENLDAEFARQKRREWGIAPDDFVVMAVGRITPVKGYENLIRAALELVPKIPNLKLVLVGDADRKHQPYLQGLKRLAGVATGADAERGKSAAPGADAGAGIGRGNFIFAGSESKIPECLSLASVVVSPNTVKPESFGLSMAEALMMGKPVVAKAFGGALDVVRDGVDGVLVREGGDFAAAIEAVRSRAFTGLREGAIERFDTAVLARRTLEVWREFL